MRIVYIGCVAGSVLKLRYVLEAGGDVAGVVTLDPALRHRHADFATFDDICAKHRIPLERVRDINAPSTLDLIRNFAPDVIFAFGWSQIIRRPLLDLPRLGIVGFHPTLLPKNRGRHPIIWALVNGCSETGATFFMMDEGADSGDIIAQRKISIDPADDAAGLMKKVNDASRELIGEFVPMLESGTARRIPQDERQATYWRKRERADGYIDWRKSSAEIYNLVRGLSRPYPGASAFYKAAEIKIWRARMAQLQSSVGAPGAIVFSPEGAVVVRTGDGALELVDAQCGGRDLRGVLESALSRGGERMDLI